MKAGGKAQSASAEKGEVSPESRAGEIARLVEAARGGDEAARAAFCQRVFRIAHHVAARRFGFAPADADDVAQEVVVRALEQLRETAVNVTWLHAAATFHCIDVRRRQKTIAESAYEVAVMAETGLSGVDRAEVMLMLERLPPSCAEVLRLHFLEGLSFVEIDERRADGRRRAQFDAKRCLAHLAELSRRRP